MKSIILAAVLVFSPVVAFADPNVSFSIGFFSSHGYVTPHVSVVQTYHYHEHYDPYFDGPRYYDPHRKVWYHNRYEHRHYQRNDRHHRHDRNCRDNHRRHRH